jgi:glucose-1-phosphate cytidylyltransferase
MKTVILCGGRGTRIRDVAADLPKPMITIGNLPILWHIMKGFAHWGYSDFILCLGYQSTAIKDFFLNYRVRVSDVVITLGRHADIKCLTNHDEEDWCVTLAETGLHSMTGARVWRIRKYLNGEKSFMLTYGDGVGNVDIQALIEFHRTHGRAVTVTGVRPPGRFGELEIDRERVVGFNEKPQVSEGHISGGFFVCEQRLFDYLDDRESLVLEEEPMRRLVADGELMVFRHDGFWHPMDTYRDYHLLNTLWDEKKALWKVW